MKIDTGLNFRAENFLIPKLLINRKKNISRTSIDSPNKLIIFSYIIYTV